MDAHNNVIDQAIIYMADNNRVTLKASHIQKALNVTGLAHKNPICVKLVTEYTGSQKNTIYNFSKIHSYLKQYAKAVNPNYRVSKCAVAYFSGLL